MSKRPMTLIETVIAMSLFSLLITVLFFWYTRLATPEDVKPTLEKRYCIERLNHFFAHLSPKSRKGISTFHKSGNSLVFTFENGPNEAPQLSDVVLARLYLDEQSHTLAMTLWPQPEKGEMTLYPSLTLPLLRDVASLEFAFFFPPDQCAGPVAPNGIKLDRPDAGWQSEWQPEYHTYPALMRLTLKDIKDDASTIYFDFPHPIILSGATV